MINHLTLVSANHLLSVYQATHHNSSSPSIAQLINTLAATKSTVSEINYLKDFYNLLLKDQDLFKDDFVVTLKNVWMTVANAISDATERLTYISLWDNVNQALFNKKNTPFDTLLTETKQQLLLKNNSDKIESINHIDTLLDAYESTLRSGSGPFFDHIKEEKRFIGLVKHTKVKNKENPQGFLQDFCELFSKEKAYQDATKVNFGKAYKEYVKDDFGKTLHEVWMTAANQIKDDTERLIHISMWEHVKQSVTNQTSTPYAHLKVDLCKHLDFKVEVTAIPSGKYQYS